VFCRSLTDKETQALGREPVSAFDESFSAFAEKADTPGRLSV
jgi:hypothetical protein